ncbi:hypothetical protein BC827DRAFT_1178198 [Russula dissimulans]|nr:hypothetical protein BC827DRAFT_1178198 [Russula dissimulans]
MTLSCRHSRRGSNPRTCRINTLSQTMANLVAAKTSQRNNIAPFHTINVVFPERTHSATPGNGDELASTDRNRNRSSDEKMNDAHLNAEISAVPDPVPNPLFQLPSSSAGVHTTLPLAGHPSPTVFVYSSDPLVPSSLLPLPSTVSTVSSTSSLSRTVPATVSAERPVGTFNKVPSQQTTPRQLPAAAIVLLTAGSVLFVIAILFLSKLYIRPRRRSHPTPSLPILQDAFPPQKMGDESPLFGGKERLSSQPGVNAVPWTWTQYQSDTLKPVPAARISLSGSPNQPPVRYSRIVDGPRNVHHAGQSSMQETMTKPDTANSPPDGHPNKALSRLSSLSGLVYTASVYESTGQENIGIAVSSGQGDLESGVSAAREYRKRASARQSMRGFDKRRSTIDGSPEGLAYTMSPAISPRDGRDDSDGFSRQGRARVKEPYVAGSYLRGSAAKGPDRPVPGSNPFADPSDGEYTLPPLPDSAAGKRTSQHGGTIMPEPPVSPDFGLYPDDSLSVADDRIWVGTKLGKGKAYDQDKGRDGEDQMTVGEEQLSSAASPGVVAGRPSMPKRRGRDQEMENLRRTDDRPPRVPSPPVLPSLAQMAMAHTNGQEYGDYRSPTYSLYGLYSTS